MAAMRIVHTALALAGLLACVSVAGADAPPAAKAPSSWEKIDEEDGIKVWKREVPGIDLPGFRGEVTIDAKPEAIFKVLDDWRHHTEWMHRCEESARLKDLGNGAALMYNRTDSPWPVWDRDVILEVRPEQSADGRNTTIHFKNVDSELREVPSKTIRMPRLVGFYKLMVLNENQTRVAYQVEADPGGSLPRWLAMRTARDLPYETLSRLRDRVRKATK